jgi:hypothetical protein
MYHECLSTPLLSLQIAARMMQEKCRMQILYSCLRTFFVERLWYTCPYYICFFKSSGLLTSASRTDTQFGSSSASRLKTKFGSGCSCGSCFEPGFGYQTAA